VGGEVGHVGEARPGIRLLERERHAHRRESVELLAVLADERVEPSHEALEQVVAMGAVEGSRMAMDQLDAVLVSLREYAQGKGTRTEILDDQHVRITRLIDGPQELVWRAHHEPALMEKWMLGPLSTVSPSKPKRVDSSSPCCQT
jgi:hypothetical protein